MSARDHFKSASKAAAFGTWVFYLVLVSSVVLLLFPFSTVESCLHPLLVVLAVLAIVCTVITIIYQTEGNRILRASQLSDAFGVGIGEQMRDGYYNNTLPKTVRRLGATTLENTFFTKEILHAMLIRERVNNCLYFIFLLALFVCRWPSTSWLLMLAQTVFSADLILGWIRLERFRMRTSRVNAHLEQFFLQCRDAVQPGETAIVLAAFTDYECAKDEAVISIDSKVFNKLNPILSKEWEKVKRRLNIR
jgi:hypothetical protein